MNKEKFGTDYGNWAVIPEGLLNEKSNCYCCGLGEDASFEALLQSKYKCNIYFIDPTSRSKEHYEEIIKALKGEIIPENNSRLGGGQSNYWDLIFAGDPDPEKLFFLGVGIYGENSVQKFFAPKNKNHVSYSISNLQNTSEYFESETKTMNTLMKELNHDSVDLLKMNIEGSENEVLLDMITTKIYPKIICINRLSIKPQAEIIIKQLGEIGYETFHNSGNNYTFILN